MFPLTQRKLIRGVAEHIADGLGAACDYKADHSTLYAPFPGKIKTYWGPQGGNWVRLTRDNGDQLEFAHLDHYIVKNGVTVKEGDPLAITGNTGQITTGPHLHVQVIIKGKRVDPDIYMPKPIYKLAIINAKQPLVGEFKVRVENFLGNQVSIVLELLNASFIPPSSGNLGTTQAMEIIDTVSLGDAKGVLIFYPRNPDSAYEVASFYPEKNVAFATLCDDVSSDIPTHAFLHLIRKWVNFNHIQPFIEDVEYYLPDWRFQEQYDAILPYFAKMDKQMNEKDVKSLQVLEGYQDAGGVAYWTGKPLSDYLAARLADKKNQIQQVQNA